MKRRAFLVGAGAASVSAAFVGARAVRSGDSDDDLPVQKASTRVQRAGDGRPGFEVEPVCYRETDAGRTEWTFRARNDDDRALEATWRVVDAEQKGTVDVAPRGVETFRVPGERGGSPTVAVATDGEVLGVAEAEGAPQCRSKG